MTKMNVANAICKINCKLYGTPHCRLLNMDNCSSCYVSRLSPEEQVLVMKDIRTIAAAMPYGGLEAMSEADECGLCCGRKKKEIVGYARFCLGHLHPAVSDKNKRQTNAYKRDTSIVVPVQLPVCKRCKSMITKINYVPIIIGLIIASMGVLIVSMESVRSLLEKSGRIIPFLVSLIAILIGVIVGNIVKGLLVNGAERKTHTRPQNIPVIRELISDGWFVITNSEIEIPITFSSKKLKQGLLTGSEQEKTIQDILKWNDSNK